MADQMWADAVLKKSNFHAVVVEASRVKYKVVERKTRSIETIMLLSGFQSYLHKAHLISGVSVSTCEDCVDNDISKEEFLNFLFSGQMLTNEKNSDSSMNVHSNRPTERTDYPKANTLTNDAESDIYTGARSPCSYDAATPKIDKNAHHPDDSTEYDSESTVMYTVPENVIRDCSVRLCRSTKSVSRHTGYMEVGGVTMACIETEPAVIRQMCPPSRKCTFPVPSVLNEDSDVSNPNKYVHGDVTLSHSHDESKADELVNGDERGLSAAVAATYARQSENKFQCDQCASRLKTQRGLYTHWLRSHSGRVKYRCSFESCLKPFYNKRAFTNHERRHRNIFTFHCELCGKKFLRKALVDAHRRVSHGPGIPCTLCGKSLKSPVTLRNHLKYVHGTNTFNCPSCNKAYKQKSGLFKHRKTCSL